MFPLVFYGFLSNDNAHYLSIVFSLSPPASPASPPSETGMFFFVCRACSFVSNNPLVNSVDRSLFQSPSNPPMSFWPSTFSSLLVGYSQTTLQSLALVVSLRPLCALSVLYLFFCFRRLRFHNTRRSFQFYFPKCNHLQPCRKDHLLGQGHSDWHVVTERATVAHTAHLDRNHVQ